MKRSKKRLRAEGVDIGDADQVEDDRAGAPEPRPGPTGIPCVFGPVDEIVDDEEVVDEATRGNDLEFVGEAITV